MIVTQLLPGHHRLFGWEKKVGRETRAPSLSPPTLCRHTGRERVKGGFWAPSFTQNGQDKKRNPKEEVTARQPEELPSGTDASWSFVGQVMVAVEA